MTTTGELAAFLDDIADDSLSPAVVEESKKRLLDSVGIAVAAMGEPAVEAVRATAWRRSSAIW